MKILIVVFALFSIINSLPEEVLKKIEENVEEVIEHYNNTAPSGDGTFETRGNEKCSVTSVIEKEEFVFKTLMCKSTETKSSEQTLKIFFPVWAVVLELVVTPVISKVVDILFKNQKKKQNKL
ncbi:hypothetical protein FQR65_LT13007 [Abscondita terminalis]|nr:hypothetical protein FQR65_LT13007 [Abscondita terminalis]